ncbi:MAG: hypothetical protein Q7R99_03520 [bacterium]|nr:hypothetical protein [bacterium]
MPRKIVFKLLLVLTIPLFLVLAISSIYGIGNLWFARIIGFLILIVFGVYAALTLFSRFGRSMGIIYREKSILKKLLIFAILFLLLIAVMLGIEEFFETAFKFIGL